MLANATTTEHYSGMNKLAPEQARDALAEMAYGNPFAMHDVLRIPNPTLLDITSRIGDLMEFMTDRGTEVRFDSNVLCEKTETATYIRRLKEAIRPEGPKEIYEVNLDLLDRTEEFAPILYGFKYAEDDWLFMIDIAWPQKGGRQRYVVVLEATRAYIFYPETHQLQEVDASNELIRSISWWFE